jgi:hypothetical protein
MTAVFEVRSSDNDGRLEFVGSVPRGLSGYDGCTFNVSLVSTPLSASVRVYDIEPHRWSEFFAQLADEWRGWKGEKERESLEGHLKLIARSDSLGHVSLRVKLRDVLPGSDWRAEGVLAIEAGQLEAIAERAKAFFG